MDQSLAFLVSAEDAANVTGMTRSEVVDINAVGADAEPARCPPSPEWVARKVKPEENRFIPQVQF